jgi:hypothetical protein
MVKPATTIGIFILTAASLMVSASATAQSNGISCGTRFGVMHLDQRLPGGGLAGMTKRQSDWFKKTGAKKFSTTCEDEEKPDYLILWTSEDTSGVVGSTAGGNGTVTTVHRDRVRFYVVAADKRDPQSALYSGEHEDSLMHWAEQSSLEDALKFITSKQKSRR